jgi:hypothetical protein
MFTSLPRRETPLSAAAWLRRITAALVAVTGGVLAWAAAVPAAAAASIPVPDPGGAYRPVPAAPILVIAAGGMPGWQITLIAVAAALAAGTTAVFLDRARAARRHASATR